jgi:hypothetical protein
MEYGQKTAGTAQRRSPRSYKKVVTMLRTEDMRRDKTTLCIIDAHSVQNADTAQAKGYDAGKKVSGIKRHIVVDTQGQPGLFTDADSKT